jgi:hypothetical protein
MCLPYPHIMMAIADKNSPHACAHAVKQRALASKHNPCTNKKPIYMPPAKSFGNCRSRHSIRHARLAPINRWLDELQPHAVLVLHAAPEQVLTGRFKPKTSCPYTQVMPEPHSTKSRHMTVRAREKRAIGEQITASSTLEKSTSARTDEG